MSDHLLPVFMVSAAIVFIDASIPNAIVCLLQKPQTHVWRHLTAQHIIIIIVISVVAEKVTNLPSSEKLPLDLSKSIFLQKPQLSMQRQQITISHSKLRQHDLCQCLSFWS
jgi:hypothetical protein